MAGASVNVYIELETKVTSTPLMLRGVPQQGTSKGLMSALGAKWHTFRVEEVHIRRSIHIYSLLNKLIYLRKSMYLAKSNAKTFNEL